MERPSYPEDGPRPGAMPNTKGQPDCICCTGHKTQGAEMFNLIYSRRSGVLDHEAIGKLKRKKKEGRKKNPKHMDLNEMLVQN